MDNVDELATAARMSASSTYNSLAELARIGLIRRRAGTITLGDTTLDDIAAQHRLAEARTTRIAAHRAARIQWQTWLATRQIPPVEASMNTTKLTPPLMIPLDIISEADYLAIVMATGPPALAVE